MDPVADLLDDLIGLQSHLREAVVRQLDAKGMEPHWDVRALLRPLEGRLDAHVAALKERLEQLGGRPSPVKEKVAALLGSVAGRIDKARTAQPVSRCLRDDYVFFSLVLVSYGILRAAASALGDDETADLAGDHLDALESTMDELTVLIPAVVEAELTGEDAGD